MAERSLLPGEKKVRRGIDYCLQILLRNVRKEKVIITFKKPFLTNAALEISSSGPSGEYCGSMFGLYRLVIGEEIEGSPVYRQAHSEEIPNDYKYLLHR